MAYLHHLEASMQCSGNGVRNVAGNTLDVQDSVIQGMNQYAVYYAGGLQPWSINNVYNETGNCTNPSYPGSLAGIAGYIATGNALSIQNDAPIGGSTPVFITGGGTASQRNYYVVPKDSSLGIGPMMFIGTAQPSTSGTSIPLYWPNPDLKGAGTRTFDIVVTDGYLSDDCTVHGKCVLDCHGHEWQLQQRRNLQLHGYARGDDSLHSEQCLVGTDTSLLAGGVDSEQRSERLPESVRAGEFDYLDFILAEGVLQTRSDRGAKLFLYAILGSVSGGGFVGKREQQSGSAGGADWAGVGVVEFGDQRGA